MYKVLWVEDDETIVDGTQLIAEDYDIDLRHFTNWAEACSELERNFEDYSAIILDAYCKIEADKVEDEIFITSILPQMQGLFGKRQKEIPWYILSAGTMSQFDFVVKSATNSRKEKEGEWGDMLYIKGAPDGDPRNQARLFGNIKRVAAHMSLNVVLNRHEETFQYMGEGKLMSSEARKIMLRMLCALHYPEENVNFECQANQIRKVVEYLFRAARKVGLLADECFDGDKDTVNLSDAALYMSGKNTRRSDVRYGMPGKARDGSGGDTILSPRTGDVLWNIIKFSNAGSHTGGGIVLGAGAKDKPYLVNDGSRELFFGYVLLLCHVIKSFGKYAKDHPDVNANKAMKRPVNNPSSAPTGTRTSNKPDAEAPKSHRPTNRDNVKPRR